jgi:sulfate adenylyltransferase
VSAPVGARGAVVFLTGISGAGKTTIARALAERLMSAGRPATVLDADELRRRHYPDLGYDTASREASVRRTAELAAALARDGEVAIAAIIAPYERSRREARELAGASVPFLLVYVRTPLEVAEARDPKGLYARARAGEIRQFTGIDSPYEEPTDAELVIDTTITAVPAAVDAISAALDAAL